LALRAEIRHIDDRTVKIMDEGEGRTAEVVLAPDPDHCIETVARNEYRRCLGEFFRPDRSNPELEARLETLQRFLEQADFRSLRRESEPLIAAGRPVRFLIGLSGERARWRIETETTDEGDEENPEGIPSC
jgi:hypothetical protein